MIDIVESSENKTETIRNEMQIEFDAVSANESFARVAVAAFVAPLNPTMEELTDIKTAVSEAVTNAIIHGYGNTQGYCRRKGVRPAYIQNPGKVRLQCILEDGTVYVRISDDGVGIEDVDKAMEPLYTTRPELDRSGMGFAFMEAFMDDLEVISGPGKGTLVKMQKRLNCGPWIVTDEL